MTAPSPARALAIHVLERVARDGAFADLALDAALARQRLTVRDTALATELTYGTLRWQRYLDWVLTPHSRRPLESLEPRVLAALRAAAYQIVFLERIPSFAAVNDAVSLAGTKPGIAGFINAVLRAFARRGTREREPPAPPDPVEALAVRCSFPTWLAARWVARYGSEDARALMLALNERPPLTVRTNTLRLSRDELARRLNVEEERTSTPTPYAPEGLVVDHGGGPPASWRVFADGTCAVQDEASMLVAHLIEAAPGDTVADVCAAPGTKTTHLAQLMADRGRILAFDRAPSRLERVSQGAARLGVTIVETRPGIVESLAPEYASSCDAVLVDAPCSNLGVLRRQPEVKWRRQPQELGRSATEQRAILRAAATMVRPGGRLVYATCSLEPEENEDVVRELLTVRADFTIDPPPSFPIPLDAPGVLRCLPHRHGTDGFTAIRVRRAL
ncbi:MAG: 16S rRNA (cytosine(967)-C(5))-methyltransferase RsmB [Candidatus Rokuibacteriota bacterium]